MIHPSSMSEINTEDPGRMSSVWGPEQVALARHSAFMPILLNLMQNLLRKFLTMGTRERVWLVLSFMVLVGAYLLWPILFSLRVDGYTSMPWSTVWIPLWVIDAIGALFFLLLLSWGPIKAPPGREEGWHDPYPMKQRALTLFQWFLFVLFQVFLVMRLDGRISWSSSEVLSPLILWLVVNTLGALYLLYIQTQRLFLGRVIEACRVVVQNLTLMIQLVFLVLKLEDEVDWNWWVVFIPLWVYHLGHFGGWLMKCSIATSLTMDLKKREGDSQEEQVKTLESSLLRDTANRNRSASCGSLVVSILAVALVNGADFSTFVVFIPLFLSAAFLVCTVSGAICCFRVPPGELDEISSHPAV
ncbi:unnamed protein product [Ascophyllum nodosum]